MFRRQTALVGLLAIAGLSALPGRAEAGWLLRSYVGWRLALQAQYGADGQLPGGQIVGATTFAAGNPQAGTRTAAQWQQLATQQQVQVYSAAQWQQLVAAQVPQPQSGMSQLILGQRTNPLVTALRQQQQNPLFGAAGPQGQQQNAPPRPPADSK
jgi:hypothetical protein